MVTEKEGKKRQGRRGGVEREEEEFFFFLKEFSGGLVVRTLGFQGQGSGSNP